MLHSRERADASTEGSGNPVSAIHVELYSHSNFGCSAGCVLVEPSASCWINQVSTLGFISNPSGVPITVSRLSMIQRLGPIHQCVT